MYTDENGRLRANLNRNPRVVATTFAEWQKRFHPVSAADATSATSAASASTTDLSGSDGTDVGGNNSDMEAGRNIKGNFRDMASFFQDPLGTIGNGTVESRAGIADEKSARNDAREEAAQAPTTGETTSTDTETKDTEVHDNDLHSGEGDMAEGGVARKIKPRFQKPAGLMKPSFGEGGDVSSGDDMRSGQEQRSSMREFDGLGDYINDPQVQQDLKSLMGMSFVGSPTAIGAMATGLMDFPGAGNDIAASTGAGQGESGRSGQEGGAGMAEGGTAQFNSPEQVPGPVAGPGGPKDDKVDANLSNGEFVSTAEATKTFGQDFLTQLNDIARAPEAQGLMANPGFGQAKTEFVQKVAGLMSPSGGAPVGAAPPGAGAPPSNPNGPPQPPMGAQGLAEGGTVSAQLSQAKADLERAIRGRDAAKLNKGMNTGMMQEKTNWDAQVARAQMNLQNLQKQNTDMNMAEGGSVSVGNSSGLMTPDAKNSEDFFDWLASKWHRLVKNTNKPADFSPNSGNKKETEDNIITALADAKPGVMPQSTSGFNGRGLEDQNPLKNHLAKPAIDQYEGVWTPATEKELGKAREGAPTNKSHFDSMLSENKPKGLMADPEARVPTEPVTIKDVSDRLATNIVKGLMARAVPGAGAALAMNPSSLNEGEDADLAEALKDPQAAMGTDIQRGAIDTEDKKGSTGLMAPSVPDLEAEKKQFEASKKKTPQKSKVKAKETSLDGNKLAPDAKLGDALAFYKSKGADSFKWDGDTYVKSNSPSGYKIQN